MPVNFGSVSTPWWGKVYLVGGGPSLRGHDLSCLRGRTVVTINDALFHLGFDPTASFSADLPWMVARRDRLATVACERYMVLSPSNTPRPIPGVIYLEKRYDTGLSTNPRWIYIRGSGGYAALNLAFLKQAREIVLLGFDFHGGRWYSSATPSTQSWILEQQAAEFNGMKQILNASRVKVINGCPDSLISAFPKVTVEEALA